MNIARILYPVEVLGPGKRVGIWFAGCPRRCKGCSNPELWEMSPRYEISPERVFSLVKKIAQEHTIDGFTLTGGDPLLQYEDCMTLCRLLSSIKKDILLYTGYRFEEIGKPLPNIAAVIDGPYIEERNFMLPLRGSDNQKLRILKEAYRLRYRRYLRSFDGGVQNFHATDGVISVGIHRPGFSRIIKNAPKPNDSDRKDDII